MAENKFGKFLKSRFDKLQSDRYNYEDTWQKISDYVLPNRGDFDQIRSPGTRNITKVFDTAAITANQLLAATLHGGLTNSATRWLELSTQDTDLINDDSLRYFEKASDTVLSVFNSTESNFQSQVHEFYLSLVSLGTAVMFIEEDNKKKISFSTIHLSEIFVQENKFGQIDTVFRKFKLTARQAAQMWENKQLGPKLTKAAMESPDEQFEFLHIVMPREEVSRKDKVGAKGLPIASYYMELSDCHILDEKGFHEMPYIIARFEKLSGELYGRSPAWNALPDIMMVNKMQQTLIRAAQLSTAPPLLVSDDGVMMPLQVRPNGVITGGMSLDGTPRVSPLLLGNNIPVGLEMINSTQKAIRDAFFVDQLIFRDQGTPVTATEIIQRQEEKLRLLSPHVGRLQSEFLNPAVERVFGLLARNGKLPDAPETLADKDIDIQYKSPLVKLQKGADIQAFQRFIASVQPLAQIDPSVLDSINPESTMRNLAEAAGMRLENLRTAEEVAEIQELRAQQQQMQLDLQATETLSKLQTEPK